MENASKALIMAAEILLGVMIISIGVYIFNSMGEFSANTSKKIEDVSLSQFNNQFLKFYGTVSTEENGKQKVEPIKCTIHDIIALRIRRRRRFAFCRYLGREGRKIGERGPNATFSAFFAVRFRIVSTVFPARSHLCRKPCRRRPPPSARALGRPAGKRSCLCAPLHDLPRRWQTPCYAVR